MESEAKLQSTLSRREVLGLMGKVGVGLTGLSLVAGCGSSPGKKALATVSWISPRGTLAVMDDFDLHVPAQMGYFKSLGIEANLIPGPTSAMATTEFVAEHKADMGYPSPGILAASVNSGIPVMSVWELFPGQVFDFALPMDSQITSVKQLANKTIAVGDPG